MHQRNVNRRKNPREYVGFFKVLSFLFTFDIFAKIRRGDLQERDIYSTLSSIEANHQGDKLEQEWIRERKLGRKSLTRALFRTYGKNYLYLGTASVLVKTTITVIKPLALGKLISYFSSNSSVTQLEAYLYVLALILCKLTHNLFVHHYQLLMSTYGLKMRVALCSLIYRKSLKLTEASLQELSNGKLVTLMTKEVTVFDTAIIFMNDLWIGMIQLVAMTVVMYWHIQESTFVGITVMVILIPLQVWIAKFATKMRLKTASKTDERLKRIQEILTSIKLLKLYSWEDYYTKLTSQSRAEEMSKLRKIWYLKGIIIVMSALSQRVSFYFCILAYMYFGNVITAEKLFVVLECFGNLRFLVAVAIPLCVTLYAECRSAMKRMKDCLLADDVDQIRHHDPPTKEAKIICRNVFVKFGNKLILQDVSFENKSTNELIAITGNVGSGKSTFLKVILKDLNAYAGIMSTHGRMSYASQEPWLFPGTIKQNILFGLDYEPQRYYDVLNSCCLLKDLRGFPEGDETIVNDKGLNLSKGQQARINLARAVYKNCDIYLLDDVMVSLDATVSEELFRKCFKEFLKDKLVLFVCHNKKYLQMTDRILYFESNTIDGDGSYEELTVKGFRFTANSIEDSIEIKSENKDEIEMEYNINDENPLMKKPDLENMEHIYGESKQEGKVHIKVYLAYLKAAGGYKILAILLLLFAAAQSVSGYFDYYVKKWLHIEEHLVNIRQDVANNLTNLTMSSEEYLDAEQAHINGIIIYSCLMIGSVLAVFVQIFSFYTVASVASRNLHNSVFSDLTKATMAFFDKNLSGNILNRFSKDISLIDEYMPYLLLDALRIFFICVSIAVVIGSINILTLAPTIVLFLVALGIRHYYAVVSRSLKRLDGITRAPIVGFLNSSLEGLTTIRASGIQETLKSQFDKHQDHHSSVGYMIASITRAFAFWLDMVCICYLTGLMLFFVIFTQPGEGKAGSVGVIITQAFGQLGLLQWSMRQWTEVENAMTCVERITEYRSVEREKTTGLNPENWPKKGLIEYRNVSLNYFDGQPVLKNINFTIKPGERVGIIGRTGAGKSSIISALFRLYEIQGSVLIDDLDIKDIQLKTVRAKISIIPQDPILFGGTLRTNLDPYGEYTDQFIWRTLEEVELKATIENLNAGINTPVQDGGANFSLGQRQLICLARAALRNNKILVLDEATANIDPRTDELLQNTIRRLFSHCTILTIAHRLHTVIDSNRILVIDSGRVVQFDTPKNLYQDQSGIFYSMASQVGLSA